MEKLGTKETEEALDAIDASADAIVKSAEDGVLNWKDVKNLLEPMRKLPAGVQGAQLIWPELKDLDAVEGPYILERFGITTNKCLAAFAALRDLAAPEPQA